MFYIYIYICLYLYIYSHTLEGDKENKIKYPRKLVCLESSGTRHRRKGSVTAVALDNQCGRWRSTCTRWGLCFRRGAPSLRARRGHATLAFAK